MKILRSFFREESPRGWNKLKIPVWRMSKVVWVPGRSRGEDAKEVNKEREAEGEKSRKRRKKRDRRFEEEESRYHNIAVIPGSVSFQIIQKPADRTYIPGPTRSSHRVIIVEGPNRP